LIAARSGRGGQRAREHCLDQPARPRFGIQADYSLGVEEELPLVDRSGREPRSEADRVIASAAPTRGRLTSEIFAAQVELVTPICRTISDAARSLADLTQRCAARARA